MSSLSRSWSLLVLLMSIYSYHEVGSTGESGLADLLPGPSAHAWSRPCAYDADIEEYEAVASFSNILLPVVGRLPRTACSKSAAIV